MKSIELSLKTTKTQYFEAMKAPSPNSNLGCHWARHTLKSTQILGFLGQFNKFQTKNQYYWDSCTNTPIRNTTLMQKRCKYIVFAMVLLPRPHPYVAKPW